MHDFLCLHSKLHLTTVGLVKRPDRGVIPFWSTLAEFPAENPRAVKASRRRAIKHLAVENSVGRLHTMGLIKSAVTYTVFNHKRLLLECNV